MKNKHKILVNWIGYITVLSLLISCKHHEDEYHSITDKIEAKSKSFHATSTTSELHTKHLNTIKITEGEHTFLIPERTGEITSFACTECHSSPLKEMKGTASKKAHWNIKLQHADEHTMNCISCHNGDNMDQLQSITGTPINFNKSYQLCSQCHSKQFTDWKGGAHGKQVKSWAPPRTALTCVNCHNPHKPHFESKWPVRYNTQKIKERE